MMGLPSAWGQLVPAIDNGLPGQSLSQTSTPLAGVTSGRSRPLIAFHRDQQEAEVKPSDKPSGVRQPVAAPSFGGLQSEGLLEPAGPREEWMMDPAMVPAAHVASPAKGSTESPESAPPIPGMVTSQHLAQTQSNTGNPRRLLHSSGISSSPPSGGGLINPATSSKRRPVGLANSFPSMDVLRTAGTGLGIALGLLLICAWLYRRNIPSPTTPLPKEVVSVLGRAPLAARQFVQLLRVGNKLVLVSVTSEGMEPITEVTDPVEVDRLLSLCMRNHTKSTTAEFQQVLNQLSREGAKGFLGK
jgi:flagellar biogenesis protein FliO